MIGPGLICTKRAQPFNRGSSDNVLFQPFGRPAAAGAEISIVMTLAEPAPPLFFWSSPAALSTAGGVRRGRAGHGLAISEQD